MNRHIIWKQKQIVNIDPLNKNYKNLTVLFNPEKHEQRLKDFRNNSKGVPRWLICSTVPFAITCDATNKIKIIQQL